MKGTPGLNELTYLEFRHEDQTIERLDPLQRRVAGQRSITEHSTDSVSCPTMEIPGYISKILIVTNTVTFFNIRTKILNL